MPYEQPWQPCPDTCNPGLREKRPMLPDNAQGGMCVRLPHAPPAGKMGWGVGEVKPMGAAARQDRNGSRCRGTGAVGTGL